MKRTLVLVLLLSICFAPVTLADEPTPPDTSSLDIPPVVSQIKASLKENVHDPGITILEAIVAQMKEIKEAVIRFGDGIRGRVPEE